MEQLSKEEQFIIEKLKENDGSINYRKLQDLYFKQNLEFQEIEYITAF